MARTRTTGNGEGTILPYKRDGRVVGYRAQLTVGWADGKAQRKTGKLRKTKAEARVDLADLKRQRDTGVTLAGRAQTVETFFPMWIDTTVAPRAQPKTLVNYRWVTTRIIAAFGTKPLPKVTGQQIQAFITQLSISGRTITRNGESVQVGMAPRTISLIYTVLHNGLDQALKWKLIPHNPAEYITRPKIERSSAKALTPEQARAFLLAARGERYELALRLMLSLGLRRGEAAGLRWDDVNFDTGTLTINGTLGYINHVGLHYGPPKTESGRRTIKLPATLLASLRWHQARQEAERAAMAGKWPTDCPYVFVSSAGKPVNSRWFGSAFKAVAARAGLPPTFTPHSLRHSCASFLNAEGVPIKTISAYLGHATTAITLELYTHLFDGALDDAAEHVERVLTRDDTTDIERRKRES